MTTSEIRDNEVGISAPAGEVREKSDGRLVPPPTPEGWVACADDECSDATGICSTPEEAVQEWITDGGGYERIAESHDLASGDLITLDVWEAGSPWGVTAGHGVATMERLQEWAHDEFIDADDFLGDLTCKSDSMDQLDDEIQQAILRHIVRVRGKLSLEFWTASGKSQQVTLTPEQLAECRSRYEGVGQ